MIKRFIFSAILIFSMLTDSFGIKESKLPFLVRKAILDVNYPLDQLKWKKHSGEIYEAYDTKGSKHFSIFISQKGELILKEEKISIDSLPLNIKETLKNRQVKTIYKITDYELKTISFDIHSTDGKYTHKGYYFDDGNIESYHKSKKTTLAPFFIIIGFILIVSQSF